MSFSNPVVGGEGGELIRESIKSPNYVPNVDGWSINRDGSAEFNDITIRDGAIVGGSVTVGDPGNPQVVIDSSSSIGRINFPTNAPTEAIPARITSQAVNDGDPDEQLWLNFTSARSTGDTDQSSITMKSTAADGSTGAEINIVAPGLGAVSSARLDLANGNADITADDFNVSSGTFDAASEIYVGSDVPGSANYPMRVAMGKVFTGSTATTINTGNTLISDANCPNVILDDGFAYEVKVRITLRSSAGTSVAGTQHLGWQLRETNVSGTQHDVEIRNVKDGIGTTQCEKEFTFIFRQTGSFTGTLVLVARKIAGGDTVEAIVNTRYAMLIRKIGDPANIDNM